jgi:hypothetical protein
MKEARPVDLFLAKMHERKLFALVASGLERLRSKSTAQKRLLEATKGKLASTNDDVASIIAHMLNAKNSGFFQALGRIVKTGEAETHAEKMMRLYNYFRYVEPIEKMTLEEMESLTGPPPEAKVSYRRLFEATKDANKNPNESEFNKLVRSAGISLEKKRSSSRKQ